VKAADKSLENEGASIEKIQPLLFQAIFDALTLIKYEFISWVWYKITYSNFKIKQKLQKNFPTFNLRL
jgi:hypothetical protein